MARLGPRMYDALQYIRRHPGTAILPVAEYVGPHGSRAYGYRTVHRLIRGGWVTYTRGHGRYALTAKE